MKIIKNYKDEYQIIESGICHPVDGEPVEFEIRRHAAGAYSIVLPDRNDPELDDEINVEPSEPEAQERIADADLLTLAGWALGEAKTYYEDESFEE